MMRVTVDPDVCQGHTLCAIAAPEIFKLREEDGHAYVDSPIVDAGCEAAVRQAAASCPEEAIVISEKGEGSLT
jgi:ferredoxin